MERRRRRSEEATKKGPWTAEEDEILKNFVKGTGPRDWSSIRSKGLLPRTGKSCRLRWVNNLRPNLKKGCKFTAEEEKVVLELQAVFGNKWATIASYLHGRTDNDVKNFWSTKQKRLSRILPSFSSSSSNNNNNNNFQSPNRSLKNKSKPPLLILDDEASPSSSSDHHQQVSNFWSEKIKEASFQQCKLCSCFCTTESENSIVLPPPNTTPPPLPPADHAQMMSGAIGLSPETSSNLFQLPFSTTTDQLLPNYAHEYDNHFPFLQETNDDDDDDDHHGNGYFSLEVEEEIRNMEDLFTCQEDFDNYQLDDEDDDDDKIEILDNVFNDLPPDLFDH